MGWIQLVNIIVGHLLSWPVFGVIAVIVFRRQLAPLVRRITSYEGLGQKLTFGQELAKGRGTGQVTWRLLSLRICCPQLKISQSRQKGINTLFWPNKHQRERF